MYPDLRSYNSGMTRPLSDDTALDVERLQIERWRTMAPDEKAAVVTGLTQAAYELAHAGVCHRYPSASPHEQFLRLALDVLGADLACRAYPEAVALRDRP